MGAIAPVETLYQKKSHHDILSSSFAFGLQGPFDKTTILLVRIDSGMILLSAEFVSFVECRVQLSAQRTYERVFIHL